MSEDPVLEGEPRPDRDDPDTWLRDSRSPGVIYYRDVDGNDRVEISNESAHVAYFDADGQLHNADGLAVFMFVPQEAPYYWHGRLVTGAEMKALNGGGHLSCWEPQDFEEWCEAAGTPAEAPDLVSIWHPDEHPY